MFKLSVDTPGYMGCVSHLHFDQVGKIGDWVGGSNYVRVRIGTYIAFSDWLINTLFTTQGLLQKKQKYVPFICSTLKHANHLTTDLLTVARLLHCISL